MAKQSRIGLAETLKQLRDELAEAQAEGADKRLRFKIAEAELEFQVEISKEAAPGAKVKIDVVGIGGAELGADAKLSRGTTHRITLKLAVMDTTPPAKNAIPSSDSEAIITNSDSDEWEQ